MAPSKLTTSILIGARGSGLYRLFVLVACLVGLAGCGDDDGRESAGTPGTETAARTETNAGTDTAPKGEDPAPAGDGHGGGHERAEDQEGGAGDEQSARSQALFTGRGGRISPLVVRVPPYISIRVELRSADGRPYELDFGDERVRVSSGLGSVSTTLDGLRPGKAYTGRPGSAGRKVRIEASAEPGP